MVGTGDAGGVAKLMSAVGAWRARRKAQRSAQQKVPAQLSPTVVSTMNEFGNRLLELEGQDMTPGQLKATRFFLRLELNPIFSNFIVIVIILAGTNAGVSTYFGDGSDYKPTTPVALEVMDQLITYIFLIEAIVKLSSRGKRPWAALYDPWNVFDFLIVLLSLLPLEDFFDVTLLRLLRLLRVLKLLNALPELQILVVSLFKSVSSIASIIALLFLLMFLYAVTGCVLYQDNDPFHFRNLGLSMLSMYRISTFEDWTDIMYINMFGCDKYTQPGIYDKNTTLSGKPMPWYFKCEASNGGSLGLRILGALFFCSFTFFATMIIFNLFIGVITENIKQAADAQQGDVDAMIEEMRQLKPVLERSGFSKQVGILEAKRDGPIDFMRRCQTHVNCDVDSLSVEQLTTNLLNQKDM